MPDTSTFASMHEGVNALAAEWSDDRLRRQQRRHLERADFDALAATGFLRGPVPVAEGGCWASTAESLRQLCAVLRVLATGDSSVALVASMHPAVLAFWLASPGAASSPWEEQRQAVFASAVAGRQWGTITSEPGSGGDIMRTRTRAERADDAAGDIPGRAYRLTGDKHFGSGFGISDFMFTTGLPDDDEAPSAFFLDMRAALTSASPAISVTAEWDGAGMAATQSHAARLDEMPATRLAWDDDIQVLTFNAAPLVGMMFTAVLLGVFDAAMEFARTQLAPKRDGMRPFEIVEWTRADLEHWGAQQVYEGALGIIERGDAAAAFHAVIRAKTLVAEAGERALRRLTQVMGGGTFSRRSPMASWFEDIRALGFLRPPWGLAFDGLFATSFPA